MKAVLQSKHVFCGKISKYPNVNPLDSNMLMLSLLYCSYCDFCHVNCGSVKTVPTNPVPTEPPLFRPLRNNAVYSNLYGTPWCLQPEHDSWSVHHLLMAFFITHYCSRHARLHEGTICGWRNTEHGLLYCPWHFFYPHCDFHMRNDFQV